MCVFFRSGDEFLRDVRPDRTNREFLILLLLFYARALHNIMFKLYGSWTDASRLSYITEPTRLTSVRRFLL